MPDGLPLTTLLSHVLVAFRIEFGNEFEHQMPHWTTNQVSPSKDGLRNEPWLVSLVMWSTCMQFINDRGVTIRELQKLARTRTNLNGMERWGYILVEPDPSGTPRKHRPSWLIRSTAKGRKAQDV